MGKHWSRWMGLSSLSALVLTLAFQPGAPAQQNEITINIVKKAGKFVFADADAKISAGQSVKWVAKDAGIPHNLVSDPEGAVKTGEFQSPTTPTQKFGKAGKVKYHCTIHGSMKGTITVK